METSRSELLKDLVRTKKQLNSDISTKNVDILLPGKHTVAVTCVESAKSLYLIDLFRNHKFLKSMNDFVTDHFENIDKTQWFGPAQIGIGTLILAFDDSNSRWVRVQVLKLHNAAGLIEGFAVDYGNSLKNLSLEARKAFPSSTPDSIISSKGTASKFAFFGVEEKHKHHLTKFIQQYLFNQENAQPLSALVFYVDEVTGVAFGDLCLGEESLLLRISRQWENMVSFPVSLATIRSQMRAFPGTIVYAEDPCMLYVHIHTADELLKLQTVLTEIGKLTSTRMVHKLARAENVGKDKDAFVLVKCTDDCYYRAKVLGQGAGNTLNVYFIDYGNCSSISVENIYEMPASLKQIPVVGFKAKLEAVLSPDVSGKFSLIVDKFFYRLAVVYADVESAFEIIITGNVDHNGVFPCRIRVLKPQLGDDQYIDLHQALANLNCGALEKVSNVELYCENDLQENIDTSKPHNVLVFDSSPSLKCFTALIQENFDRVLNTLMKIKNSMCNKLRPFKSNYSEGELVLFDSPEERDGDMPFNRGVVLSCEADFILIRALELHQKLKLHVRSVVPYLKTFALSDHAVYPCVCSHEIPNRDSLDGEYLAQIVFSDRSKVRLNGSLFYPVESLVEL